MAIPGDKFLLNSDTWDRDELFAMKNLLQRAEQRIRSQDADSNHAMKAASSCKYAMGDHIFITDLIFRLDYSS